MVKTTGIMLIGASIFLAVLFIYVAINRPLTSLENVLLQSISLCLGLIGSYVLGRESASNAAKDLIKPYARSAFRRLLFLYYGLSRLAQAIQDIRKTSKSESISMHVLDKLEVMVIDQIVTADDALDDWRDIVPEDVEELVERIKKRQNRRTRND